MSGADAGAGAGAGADPVADAGAGAGADACADQCAAAPFQELPNGRVSIFITCKISALCHAQYIPSFRWSMHFPRNKDLRKRTFS